MRTRLFYGLVLLFAAAALGQQIDPALVEKAKSATVYIVVKQSADGEEMKGSGSGFFIDPTTVITNAHVVSAHTMIAFDRDEGLKIVKAKVEEIQVALHSGTDKMRMLPVEVVAVSEEDDLAVLRLKEPGPGVLALGDSDRLTETEGLWIFGFPFGEMLALGKRGPAISINKGNVSSLRKDDDNVLRVVQFDGSANPGNSGGPLLDAKGSVAAITVAGVRGGSSVNFGIPVNVLKSFLSGRLTGVACEPERVAKAGGKVKVQCRASVLKGPPRSVQGHLESEAWETVDFDLKPAAEKGVFEGEVEVPAWDEDLTEPVVFTLKLTGKGPSGSDMNTLRTEIYQVPGSGKRPASGGTVVAGGGNFRIEVSPATCKVADLSDGIAAYTDSGETLTAVPDWLVAQGAKIVQTRKADAAKEEGVSISCAAGYKVYVLAKPGIQAPWLTMGANFKKFTGAKFKVGGETWDSYIRYMIPGTIVLGGFNQPDVPNYVVLVAPNIQKARVAGEKEKKKKERVRDPQTGRTIKTKKINKRKGAAVPEGP